MKVFIYALVDPRDSEEIRYVGKATDLNKRYVEHMRNATYKRGNTHCYAWIRKLGKDGITPALKVLAEVDECDWKQVEQEQIAKYHSLGHRLTNSTVGGDGVPMTENVKAKHKASVAAAMQKASREGRLSKPKSEQHRQKLSAALKGKKQTAEHRANLSKVRLGKPLSEAHKAAIAAGHRAYHQRRANP